MYPLEAKDSFLPGSDPWGHTNPSPSPDFKNLMGRKMELETFSVLDGWKIPLGKGGRKSQPRHLRG